MAEGFVDWGTARSVATMLSRGGAEQPWPAPASVEVIAQEALRRVRSYSGLVPAAPVPDAELISRDTWVEANAHVMRDLVAPLERRTGGDFGLPRPLAGIARGALGAAAGAEAGVVLGYAARRVLGQYHVSLAPSAPPPPRLLLVAPNLTRTAVEIGAGEEDFLRWVLIHEQTHSVQFAAVTWLRGHLAGMVSELLDSTASGLDLSALGATVRRLAGAGPRAAAREALRGELARALAGPEQAALLDRLQATMAVVEGYAEHVMDAAAGDDPALARMRAAMDERRRRPAGLADAIARVLGLGMKLRQYELGKGFCDSVASAGGIATLDRVWDRPDALPSQAELEAPGRWLERVAPAAPAASA